jgi:adenosylmethionine-8-amino-7-oxononanoate aminotransferase
MEFSFLAERDQRCIWHPFTQMQTAPSPIPIRGGKGAYLIGEDGTRYLDAFSSWWVNLHGHTHPYLIKKLMRQAQSLEHVVLTDFTHLPAVELGERLLKLLPSRFAKIFYSDNGSTAIETALKIVFQYWYNQNLHSKKQRIVCFNNAYHGDTFGAMSLAGRGTFNRPFWPYLFEVISIDPPLIGQEEHSLKQLEKAASHEQLAGFIFEPHIQGVGGMKTHSLQGLDDLIAYCQKQGILTIADEIMTGFGRTGPLFVCQQLKHAPDIICLAKGITGGMLPMGATLCTQSIFEAFLSQEKEKALLHGHSYYGNPLACATALASLDLLCGAQCQSQRLNIEHQHQVFCQRWQHHPSLKRLECVGTILIVEYQKERSYFGSFSEKLKKFFLARDILVRPMGNVLHVMPPYCVDNEDLHCIYQAIIYSLENRL